MEYDPASVIDDIGRHWGWWSHLSPRIPTDFKPVLCVVLGSGWRTVFQSPRLTLAAEGSELCYADVEELFDRGDNIDSGARIAAYYVDQTPVLVIDGRLHLYDTLNLGLTAMPHWLAHQLGVKRFVLTSEVLAISHFPMGALVRIGDHDTMGFDPFLGVPPDMFRADRGSGSNVIYSSRLIEPWKAAMSGAQSFPYEGFYVELTGGSTPTPMMVRRLRAQGVNLIGHSLGFEAAHLHSMGAEVFGVGCVARRADEGGVISAIQLGVMETDVTAARLQGPFLDFLVAAGA